jgi:sulfopyruvate decarboxylase subunit beta
MIQPLDALRAIAEQRKDSIAVSTMTSVEPWHAMSPHELNVTCIGFMGGASSLGLGLALAQPERRVIVRDGDGSLLMQLGSLATVAGAAPANFYHFVFKNGVYQVSGSQAIPASSTVDFSTMAKGAGYAAAYTFDNLEDLRVRLAAILEEQGPVMIQLLTEEVPNAPQGGQIGGGASFPSEAETARAALTR